MAKVDISASRTRTPARRHFFFIWPPRRY